MILRNALMLEWTKSTWSHAGGMTVKLFEHTLQNKGNVLQGKRSQVHNLTSKDTTVLLCVYY